MCNLAHKKGSSLYQLLESDEDLTDFTYKSSKVWHAYRVNCWMELVKIWHVDRITIIGVPFCGLKGFRKKTTEI